MALAVVTSHARRSSAATPKRCHRKSIDGRDEHRVRLVGVEQPNLANRHVAEPKSAVPPDIRNGSGLRQRCGSNTHTSPCRAESKSVRMPTLIEPPGAGVRWRETQRLIWPVPVVQRSSHAVKAGSAHAGRKRFSRLRMCGSCGGGHSKPVLETCQFSSSVPASIGERASNVIDCR